jgi:hypothetical protein
MRLLGLLLLIAGTFQFSLQAQAPAMTKPGPAFLAVVSKHFAEWDIDKNGTLTGEELDQLVGKSDVRGPKAAAIAAMKRAMRSNKYECPPITLELVKKQSVPGKGADGKVIPPDFGSLYKNSLDRIEKANRKLFIGEPKLDAIHQGRLGDCFCLAPLGAMLNRNPKDVAGMFETQASGSILVQLGGNEKIEVQPLTDCEIALTSSTEQSGLWVNIYEKSMGIYRAKKKGDSAPANPIESISKGGSTAGVMELLTGHDVRRFITKPLRENTLSEAEKTKQLNELKSLFVENVNAKRLICTSTPKEIKLPPGMTPNHAYAVLGYDAVKEQILIWNPHGSDFKVTGTPGLQNGYPRQDGKFTVPLNESLQMFTSFSFETAKVKK